MGCKVSSWGTPWTHDSTYSVWRKLASEVVEVKKSVQCSMLDQMKSSCGNESIMSPLPNINGLSSHVAKGLSTSELSSKRGIGASNTECKGSCGVHYWTQDSTYSMKKNVGKVMVLSEVLEVTNSVQCSMVDKTNSLSGDGNVMVALPNANDFSSNIAQGLSCEPPSKTSSNVTYWGCKVSCWGTTSTQDSTYSLMKKTWWKRLASWSCAVKFWRWGNQHRIAWQTRQIVVCQW